MQELQDIIHKYQLNCDRYIFTEYILLHTEYFQGVVASQHNTSTKTMISNTK